MRNQPPLINSTRLSPPVSTFNSLEPSAVVGFAVLWFGLANIMMRYCNVEVTPRLLYDRFTAPYGKPIHLQFNVCRSNNGPQNIPSRERLTLCAVQCRLRSRQVCFASWILCVRLFGDCWDATTTSRATSSSSSLLVHEVALRSHRGSSESRWQSTSEFRSRASE